MRPADPAFGEDEALWLERAREAARSGPLGHHTHWTAPDHARPTGGGTGERVLAEGARTARARSRADALLRRRLVHGRRGRGGVRRARVRRLHAARARDRRTSREGERWASLDAPAVVELPSGRTLRAIPTTHSLGDLARGARAARLPEARPRLLPRHGPPRCAPASAPPRRCCRCSRAARRSTDLDALAARIASPTRPASRGTTWRGSKHPRRCRQGRSAGGDVASCADAARTGPRRPRLAPLRALARADPVRSSGAPLSVAALVVLDVVGLAFGIYLALVIRQVVTGDGDVLWGLLWREGPAEWLKFAAPITVLVFAQAGPLSAARAAAGRGADPRLPHRRRAHRARVRDRDGLRLLDLGPHPDLGRRLGGHDRAAPRRVRVGVARGHARGRDQAPGRPRRRRREPRAPARVARVGPQRAHVRVRRRRRARGRCRASGCSGRAPSSPLVLDEVRPDEVILTEADFDERTVLEVVEQAHRQGIKVRLAPDTTELLVQRGEYVPGQGAPLFELRPPVLTGWDWAVKRGFDLARERARRRDRRCRCGRSSRSRSSSTRAGRSSSSTGASASGSASFAMLKFRTMVAERGRAAARARGRERGRGRALQDPRGPARHPRRPVPPPLLARRDPAGRQRAQGRDEPRRAAPAAAARLRAPRGLAPRGATRVLPGHDRPLADLRAARGSRSTTSCASTSRTSRTGRSGSTSRSSSKTIPAVITRRGAY